MSVKHSSIAFSIGCSFAVLTATPAFAKIVDESSVPAVRRQLSELASDQRRTLVLRTMLSILSTSPDALQRMQLSEQLRNSITALLATESDFNEFVEKESARQLQQLCRSERGIDAVFLAHAIRSVDSFREDQRKARYQTALQNIDGKAREELDVLLADYQMNGESYEVDLQALAEKNPAAVTAPFHAFCARGSTESALGQRRSVEFVGNPSSPNP
jgi:hypothetical protein